MKRLSSILIIGMLVLGVLVFTGCEQEVEQIEEEVFTSVEVQEVKLDSINLVTTFTGRVQSKNIVPVMVLSPGEVESVFVSNGDYVKKDQKLFSLVGTNSKSQVDQAQAAYNSASANYELTKQQIKTAKENYTKIKKLYESGAVSKSQLDQADLAASELPLEATKGAVDQARIALNSAQNYHEDTVVRAPISGVVSGMNAKENSFITNTQPALMISDNSQLDISINVSESYVNKISENDIVGIYLPAIEYNYDGKVKETSSSLDPNSFLYPVKIVVDKIDENIKSGMIAQVEIITESKNDVLVVPAQAVLLRGDKEVVFTFVEGLAVQKEVITGIDNGKNIEIKEGLEVGEEVIVLGQNFISSGDKISIVGGE